MLKITLSRLMVLMLIMGSFSFIAEPDFAQSQSSHFVLKRDSTGTLTLYSVSTAGNLQELFQFPANISLNTDQANAEWNILSIESFVPSPNGQHIAFVAYHDEANIALFIYTIGETILQQQSIPGLGSLKWSPDSQSLLVTHLDRYYGSSFPEIGSEAYLYELATGKFAPLIPDPTLEGWNFIWLSDSRHLMFIRRTVSCNPECITTHKIHVVDRDSGELRALTDNLLTLDVVGGVCKLVWSSLDQRLYYVVGCISGGDGDTQMNHLYSVDLNGNNRLELSPTAFKSQLQLRYSIISEIIPNLTVGGVYVTVELEEMPTAENPSPLHYTQLLYIDPASTYELIFEQFSNNRVDHLTPIKTVLSPAQDELLFTGGSPKNEGTGYLIDIDLSTRKVKINNEYPGAVCSAQWIDESHLLYSIHSGYYCTFRQTPISTWLLNVDTGETIDITAGQSGTFYIIPAASIEPEIAKTTPSISQKPAD